MDTEGGVGRAIESTRPSVCRRKAITCFQFSPTVVQEAVAITLVWNVSIDMVRFYLHTFSALPWSFLSAKQHRLMALRVRRHIADPPIHFVEKKTLVITTK